MSVGLAQAVCECEFFRGLARATCEQLAAYSRVRSLRKRETLFLEQSKGSAIFLLVEGSIGLTKTTPDGSAVVIRTVKRGETFGEVILFEQDRYPVTATALAASKVMGFARLDILRLLEHAPFRNDFIAMLMRKQRYLAERVRYLTAYDVEQRFALFLKEQYGERPQLTPTISKKDIAAAIGATPETFSRLLQRLKRERLVQWKGKTLLLRPAFWAKA